MRDTQWFRVTTGGKPTYQGRTEIVCGDCLRRDKLTLLNRVFGAAQTCAHCGQTDRNTQWPAKTSAS